MRYSLLPIFALAGSIIAAPVQSSTWEDLAVPYELPADISGPLPLPMSPKPQDPWTEKKEPSVTEEEPTTGSVKVVTASVPVPGNSNQNRPLGQSPGRGPQPPLGQSPGRGPQPAPGAGSSSRQREDAIRYNLRRVNQALTALDESLQRKPRYWRSQQELDDYFHRVWDLGNIVVNELHNGADDIRYNAVSLSDAEALGLQRQVSTLDTQLGNVVTLIISSKRDVDEIYRRREVLDLLTRAEVDMGNFIDAIISRLSGLSQTIGRGIRSRFVTNLERAVRDYRR